MIKQNVSRYKNGGYKTFLIVVVLLVLAVVVLVASVHQIKGNVSGYDITDAKNNQNSVEVSMKVSFYRKIETVKGYKKYNLIRGEVSISPCIDEEFETCVYKLYGPIYRLENNDKESSDIFIANGWRYNSQSNTIINISVLFDEDFKRVLIKENLAGKSGNRTYIGLDKNYEIENVLEFFEPFCSEK